MSVAAAPVRFALYPQQDDFVQDDRRYVCFVGGRNCVAGDTLVEGVPIAERIDAGLVATLRGPAWATPAFRKGRTDLYRVRTQSGAVVEVAPGHRFLTPTGWRQLADLRVGDVIAADGSESARSAFGRSRGWTGHCFADSHRNGELSSPVAAAVPSRLLQPHTIDVDTIPLEPDHLSSLGASHRPRRQPGESRHDERGACEQLPSQLRTIPQSPARTLPRDSGSLTLRAEDRAPGVDALCPHESLACGVLPKSSSVPLPADARSHAGSGSRARAERPQQDQPSSTSPLAPMRSHAAAESPTRHSETFRAGERRRFDSRAVRTRQSHVVGPLDNSASCGDYTITWDNITDIAFTRNTDYYDLTVPSAGHYSAHGLWHHNSGKTYAGSVKAFLKATQPGLGVIAAPDYPMLRDGAYQQFKDRLRDADLPFTENKNDGKLFIPDTGAEITFATLETESRVRGPNYAWGWVDELDYLVATKRDIWKALKGAIRAGLSPQLFATSTPKGRRLIYREWVVDATDRHELYRATSYDNPFVDATDYVASLSYEGQFYDQEINAEFVSFEGLIYPTFSQETNVMEMDCTGWRTLLGVDVGARNPTAILTIRRSGDGRTHVEREVYQRNLSSDDISDLIAKAFESSGAGAGYCDPSALAYIESLQRQGYPIQAANNDVLFGISTVTTAFADGLTVDPACVNTIAEFESYQWVDKAGQDRPVKANDHALDALRYAIVGDTTEGDYSELDAYMARQLRRGPH